MQWPCRSLLYKSKNSGGAVRIKLEHFDRVPKIEVEDFVRVQNVHFGKNTGFEQVVNCGAVMPNAARQLDRPRGGVGTAEGPSFDGVRGEIQKRFDFAGGHRSEEH